MGIKIYLQARAFCVCTCAESSSMRGATLFHLLDKDGVHRLQSVPLSP